MVRVLAKLTEEVFYKLGRWRRLRVGLFEAEIVEPQAFLLQLFSVYELKNDGAQAPACYQPPSKGGKQAPIGIVYPILACDSDQ